MQIVDPAAFAEWCGRDLSAREIEVFACRDCEGIVIGLPDEHSIYFDPTNPQRTSFYNGPPIRCPLCRAVWYGRGTHEYRVRRVNREELLSSGWAWLASSAA